MKKAQREREGGQGGSSDDEFDRSGGAGRSAEDKIKDNLFDDVDGILLFSFCDTCIWNCWRIYVILYSCLVDLPDDVGDEEELAVEEDVVGSEDEMADFIVDEDGNGQPRRYILLCSYMCLMSRLFFSDSIYSTKFFRGDNRKKRYRQGSDMSAIHDANEIFGDVGELLSLRKKGLASSERMERRLEDEFEPTILSEKYMTGKDDEIRQVDIPERMQVRSLSMCVPML